jgi:hypothetical protein
MYFLISGWSYLGTSAYNGVAGGSDVQAGASPLDVMADRSSFRLAILPLQARCRIGCLLGRDGGKGLTVGDSLILLSSVPFPPSGFLKQAEPIRGIAATEQPE